MINQCGVTLVFTALQNSKKQRQSTPLLQQVLFGAYHSYTIYIITADKDTTILLFIHFSIFIFFHHRLRLHKQAYQVTNDIL